MADRDYITVSELNYYLNSIVSNEDLLQNVPVVGEVSGKQVKSNNCYFVLKDSKAQININVFRCEGQKLPEEGEKVLVRGRVNYYQPKGTVSIIAYEIIRFGIGELYAKLQQLKQKLEEEGLFDESHKKEIPEIPQKIGIITSVSGAAIQDILSTLHRRGSTQDISIIDVRVQGESCVDDIVTALTYADAYGFDVILLVRGGGSFEDLYSFNDERIVRAIYNMNTPVITGVGHETDYTLCDYVSDYRAITPTAAAEKIFVDRNKQKKEVLSLLSQISFHVNSLYGSKKNKTINLAKNIANSAQKHFQKETLRIKNNLILAEKNIEFNYRLKIARFDTLSDKLDTLSPIKLLKKGYFRIIYKDEIVNSFRDIPENEQISIYGEKERIIARILKKEEL